VTTGDTQQPTVRRGRPRDEGVAEAVRQAARDLLAEVGYAKTTMAEIAERANVSLPTI
jgi:AcrR family transcriptional regulator